jgi:antitoxin component of MazEF toxin-antitoxin module
MRVRVQKWGNRLLSVVKGKLVATPAARKKTTLAQLLAKVSRANIHGEVEIGPSVGREAW